MVSLVDDLEGGCGGHIPCLKPLTLAWKLNLDLVFSPFYTVNKLLRKDIFCFPLGTKNQSSKEKRLQVLQGELKADVRDWKKAVDPNT